MGVRGEGKNSTKVGRDLRDHTVEKGERHLSEARKAGRVKGLRAWGRHLDTYSDIEKQAETGHVHQLPSHSQETFFLNIVKYSLLTTIEILYIW